MPLPAAPEARKPRRGSEVGGRLRQRPHEAKLSLHFQFKCFRANEKLSSAFQRGKPDVEEKKYAEDGQITMGQWPVLCSHRYPCAGLLWAACMRNSSWKSWGLVSICPVLPRASPGVTRSTGARVGEPPPSKVSRTGSPSGGVRLMVHKSC